MTSAFAQHKLVQKPSKQHRFDCLASKLHSSRVAHLNWADTQRNTRNTTQKTPKMIVAPPGKKRESN